MLAALGDPSSSINLGAYEGSPQELALGVSVNNSPSDPLFLLEGLLP